MTITMANRLTLWRDLDPRVNAQPGMYLGQTTLGPDPVAHAREFFDRGVRLVRLEEPVDTTGNPAAVHALALVRELTGHGIAVDWRLRLDGVEDWRTLGHLFPPAELTGGADGETSLNEWRSSYHIGRCVYRRGPGFLQVRDHRFGGLRRYTIREAGSVAAVERLIAEGPDASPSEDMVTRLSAAHLVLRVADAVLWLPHRVHRWPLPAALI